MKAFSGLTSLFAITVLLSSNFAHSFWLRGDGSKVYGTVVVQFYDPINGPHNRVIHVWHEENIWDINHERGAKTYYLKAFENGEELSLVHRFAAAAVAKSFSLIGRAQFVTTSGQVWMDAIEELLKPESRAEEVAEEEAPQDQEPQDPIPEVSLEMSEPVS